MQPAMGFGSFAPLPSNAPFQAGGVHPQLRASVASGGFPSMQGQQQMNPQMLAMLMQMLRGVNLNRSPNTFIGENIGGQIIPGGAGGAGGMGAI